MIHLFEPKHVENPRFQMRWHPACGHISWIERATPLPECVSSESNSDAPRRSLRHGFALCSSCRKAQASPDLTTARLIGSFALKRITAIGFHIAERERLKELRFRWNPNVNVWYFEPTTGSIESNLEQLSAILGCPSEMIDTRVAPPLPEHQQENTQPRISPAPRQDTWAVITCLLNGQTISLTSSPQRKYTVIGSIPWPPHLENLPTPEAANLPSETPMALYIPALQELHDLGFTGEEFFNLVLAAAAKNLTIITRNFEFSGGNCLMALNRLPKPSPKVQAIPEPGTKARGGRPATARNQSPEIHRLHLEGKTDAEVATTLGISRKSVARYREPPRDLTPLSA
jgi:hypothetical protein